MSRRAALREGTFRGGTASCPVSARRDHPSPPILWVVFPLSVPGTSSVPAHNVWDAPFYLDAGPTGTGVRRATVGNSANRDPETLRKAIAELRRIAGLTWEELGALFEVSRREILRWASGKPLDPVHGNRITQVLAVVRGADRGNSGRTRAALLDASQAIRPIDLLISQRFDDASVAMGQGRAAARPVLPSLSERARSHRRPAPPAQLYDAVSERVHSDIGRSRAAPTLRNQRHEPA